MKRTTQLDLEMARSCMAHCQAHPDNSAGYLAALAILVEGVASAESLETQVRSGDIAKRTATGIKRALRARIERPIVAHIASAADMAAAEVPGLDLKFDLPRTTTRFADFVSAAKAIAVDATTHKGLLVRHGMSEEVLASLVESLAELDKVVHDGKEALRARIGANAALEKVLSEIKGTIRVIDAYNRFRFAEDPERLASWVSAANAVGPFHRKASEAEGTGQAPATGKKEEPAA